MFKKILVPLDGSELAERALEPAIALSRQTPESEVILLTVSVYKDILVSTSVGFDLLMPDQSLDHFREDSEMYLQDIVARYQGADTRLKMMIEDGDIGSVIIDTAVEEAVDLIVMTTHGYSGVSRWLLGSITERVLRNAPCPILIIREKRPLTNIIITLDGSDLSETALEPGIEIGRLLGGRVTLLQVDEGAELGSLEISMLDLAEAGMSRHVQKQATDNHMANYLKRISKRYEDDLPIETVLLEGSPAQNILDFAEAMETDLIVMTTHGRTGLKRWVYGSVTEKVMRGTSAAMLIVRPQEEQLN